MLGNWPPKRILTLINRGDILSVERGRLVVRPASGHPVPDSWMCENEVQILTTIGLVVSMPVLAYQSYSTKAKNYDGIELVFSELTDSSHQRYPVAYFNAVVRRQRTTAAGMAGDRLRSGHFSIRLTKGKRPPAFWMFWQRCGLKQPNKLSTYHERMGQLSSMYFTADIESTKSINHKIKNETLRPLSVSSIVISESMQQAKSADNFPIRSRQLPDKAPISKSDIDFAPDQWLQGIQTDQTTGPETAEHSYTETQAYRASKQDGEGGINIASDNIILFGGVGSSTVSEQTTDEWLADYDRG